MAVIFEETVIVRSESQFTVGECAYNSQLTDSKLKITFNGVSYICNSHFVDASDASLYYYGGFSESGPVFNEYPFVLESIKPTSAGFQEQNKLYTETAGTYAIKVETVSAVNKVVFGEEILIDLTSDTVTPETLLEGYTAHDKSGKPITGTATRGGRIWKDENGYVHLSDDGNLVGVEPLTVTENGTYTAPTGKAYSPVIVNVELQPSGVKYLYSDVDGEGAWTGLSGYEYVSYDFAPVRDNKFRLWIEVDSSDLTFTMPVAVPTYAAYRYTGAIDWGDGTESEYSYGNLNNVHTYATAGRYVVTARWTGGSERFTLDPIGSADINKVIVVEIWYWNYPNNNFALGSAQNLKKVSFSSEQTDISFIHGCPSLERLDIPNTATTLGSLYRNTALTKLIIPASVTTIGTYCFSGNTGMKEYHFLSITPPTLGNADVFKSIPSDCVIYVPSASVEAYKTASIWSTYASYIQGE